MVTDRVRIDSLAAGQARLAEAGWVPGTVLVVTVERTVPPWLRPLVAAARRGEAPVVVEARTPADLDVEPAAGWEIGVCTAALAAGADDVTGIDPQRLARVREITRRLDVARPGPTPGGAP